MSKKIYIASGLKNYSRVLEFRDILLKYDINLTYDWASVYQQHLKSGKVEEDNLEEIASKELQGVLKCDLFLFISPAGRGGHFELGLAYAKNKPIVFCQESDDMIAFYTLPGIKVTKTTDETIDHILMILGVDHEKGSES
jgi:nucleoside 2-deoxyribosyltransferase